ncbi:MAG: hypothetical protein ACXWV4_09375 [Flavitalea sp.]
MEYMEGLAGKHKAIGHSEEESHFAEVIISNQPFPQTYLHNFVNGLRSGLHWPCMLAESYENEYSGSSGDTKLNYLGAFLILDKVVPDDMADMRLKISACERIANQFLAKMESDFNYADPVLAYFNINAVSIEKIGPINKEIVGVRVDFKYLKPEFLEHNPDNWKEE